MNDYMHPKKILKEKKKAKIKDKRLHFMSCRMFLAMILSMSAGLKMPINMPRHETTTTTYRNLLMIDTK